jgi:ABC-2 type transport system permease protein
MKTLMLLVRYDLRQQLRERGTWGLLAVIILLAWCGLYQGSEFAREGSAAATRATQQEAAARLAAQQYAEAFFADPDKPAHLAARSFRNVADIRGYTFREHIAFAAKPALPGAALAIGQSDVLPGYVRVRAESMDSVRNSNEIEHPTRLAVGRFDLLFVIIYLWPLVLLALNLTALTADRETRRVEALRLQGVSSQRLLWAQVLGRSSAATAVLVLAVGVAGFAFAALPATLAGVGAMLSWAFVVSLYSLFWAATSAAICAACATRATAAFAAFGTWVVIAILLPQLLVASAAAIHPTPSRERYLLDVREAVDRVNADRVNMIQRFYDQHPEWRPQNTPLDKVPAPVVRLARAAELEKKLADTEAQFQNARTAQTRFLHQAMVLSPVTLAHTTFVDLAGTGATRHDTFIADVRAFQLDLRNHFQTRLQQSALQEEQTPCKHPSTTCRPGFGFVDHDKVPSFNASATLHTVPAMPLALLWIAVWIALLALMAKRAWRWVEDPTPSAA